MAYKLLYLARRNPAATAAEFPKLWRSHAAFVGQFGAVGNRFTRVMQCSRALDEPGIAAASAAYDGVAVLTCPTLEDTQTQGLPPDVRAKVDVDEQRVFGGLVEDFSMRAAEHVLMDRGFDAARERAAVITFMRARPGTTRAALCKDLKERHAAALLAIPAVARSAVRYVLNEVSGQPPAGYQFDAVSELWFPSVAEAVAAHADPAARAALSALEKQLDPLRDAAGNVMMFTRVTHTWTAPQA